MKASSESGLWALVISRGQTEGIVLKATLSYNTRFSRQEEIQGREKYKAKWERAVIRVSQTEKILLAAIVLHITCSALKTSDQGIPMNPTVQVFRTACLLHADETALFVVRFYFVTSRRSEEDQLFEDGVCFSGSRSQPDSTFSLRLNGILVNSPIV